MSKRDSDVSQKRVRPPPRPERTFWHSGFQVRKSKHGGEVLLDRYGLIGLLDQGGMCDVFLAQDKALDRIVAIKRLRPYLTGNPDVRERFLTEARASIAAEHPGVILVHGIESPQGAEPFIVMEALRGEVLSEYLRRESLMPQELALRLARQLASALGRAHRVGIVHRDVKPGNLFLVGERGNPDGIKVIDFGLALESSSKVSRRTSRRFVVGTAQYMAPEQIVADPVDARTDVYGFGVVLFRCVTGHLPFDLDAGTDLLGHQMFSPAPPPSWLRDGLDPRLEELILRCMRKHPANRYQSMEAVLGDLEIVAVSLGSPRGAPISNMKLQRVPDLFAPKNPKGRDAAEFLAQEFGTDPPPPPSVQVPSSMPPSIDRDRPRDSEY